MRTHCIQPAACVSLSVFLHLTPVVVSPRENVHTNFLAIFHPRADTSHRARIVLLRDKILRNGYSFSELVSSLGSLFLTPLGWHSTFQILKLCAFMTLHKRAVYVSYTFNIHRIWVSYIFLLMWKMKKFICIKVRMNIHCMKIFRYLWNNFALRSYNSHNYCFILFLYLLKFRRNVVKFYTLEILFVH